MAIIARTNRMCMTLPAENTKNPKIHPMISRTAIRYNMLLIKKVFVRVYKTIAIPKTLVIIKKSYTENQWTF